MIARFRLLLVDDTDRTELQRRLLDLGANEFEVIALPPPVDLSVVDLLNADAHLYLVDYELDTLQPDGTFAPYLGMTLAARLREVKPEYPIVLLTRSDLPKWTAAQRTARAGATFDELLYKDIGLAADPDGTRARLLALARGYEILRSISVRSVSALLDSLQTDQVGSDYAKQALPPSDGWRGFEAAHWIRSILLRYPGVLYDDRHAATALGISAESFAEYPVQELLRDAAYLGPFSEAQPRWWRHSLFEIAYGICLSKDLKGGLRERFRVVASDLLGLELDASRDDETRIAPADTVCHLLGVPVRLETSLPYQPDSRPEVMEKARISFRAIRESNDVEETYVDAASRHRIDEIRSSVDGD